ncbi:MAG: FecR domain-containing protein [Bdellovibrionales bacterium]
MAFYRTFVVLSLSLTFAAVTPAWAAEAHGVLQVVKGNVQVKSAKDGKISKAKVGAKIFSKDTIITGKDSRAKIVMVDNNVINVSPDTHLEIQNYEYKPEQGKKDVLLNVLYGKVRSKVEQKYDGKSSKFELKTPTAVAGVRGTDFMAGYSPTTNSSSIVTFEGSVAFGQPGPNGTILNPVSVTPGLTSEMVGNQPPPPPRPVPPQQLAALDRDTKADAPAAPPAAGPGEPRTPAAQEKNEDKKDQPNQPQQPGAANENKENKDNKQVSNPNNSGGGTAAAGRAVGSAVGASASAAGNTAGGTTATPSPGTGPGMPAVGREPASIGGGGSMLLPSDFAGAPTANVLPNLGSVMPIIPSVNLPALPTNTICDFCNRLIEDGNNTLIIRVNH